MECKYRAKKNKFMLEDEQRSVHNLSQNTVQAFDLNAEKAVADSEEGVVLGIETM
jgi:cell division protein FtsZ